SLKTSPPRRTESHGHSADSLGSRRSPEARVGMNVVAPIDRRPEPRRVVDDNNVRAQLDPRRAPAPRPKDPADHVKFCHVPAIRPKPAERHTIAKADRVSYRQTGPRRGENDPGIIGRYDDEGQ